MGLTNHDLPSPPAGKYPAKAHARRVAEYLREHYEDDVKEGERKGGKSGDVVVDGVIYLEAQKTHMVEVSYVCFTYALCVDM